jgi:DNA-binding CsgD family transcriptional regulator
MQAGVGDCLRWTHLPALKVTMDDFETDSHPGDCGGNHAEVGSLLQVAVDTEHDLGLNARLDKTVEVNSICNQRLAGHPNGWDRWTRGDATPAAQAGWAEGCLLTTCDTDEYVLEAMRAGASGFLLKDLRKGQLVRAVHRAAAGDLVIDPAIVKRLVDKFANQSGSRGEARVGLGLLTQREIDVLNLMSKGLRNAELASELLVSESTVKTHVGRILDKLELRDRVQAVILAYETGLVDAS